MAWTTPVVEISTADPSATDNWQDITAYVKNLSIKTGRSSELDDFSAGSISLTLDNRDRRFDPLYAAGPYYGNLLPRRKVRVRAQAPDSPVGTLTQIAGGYIKGWPQSYDYVAGLSEVELDAVDGVELLSNVSVRSSIFASWITNKLKPTHWFRLYESEGPLAYDQMSALTGTYPASGIVYADDVVDQINSPSDAVCITVDGAGFVTLPGNLVNPSGPFTIQVAMKAATSATGRVTLLGFANSIAIRYDPIIEQMTLWAGSLNLIQASVGAQAWRTITLTYDGLTLKLYSLGALLGQYSFGSLQSLGDMSITYVGGSLDNRIPSQWFRGSLRDVIFYDYVLSQTQINDAGLAEIGWPGQLTGDRIAALLDLAGWTGPRSIDLGRSYADRERSSGTSVYDLIKRTATTDGGVFFIGPDGVANFRDRWAPQKDIFQTTVMATFADDGLSGSVPYLEASPSLDDQYIYNDISVARAGGSAQVSASADSKLRYGIRGKDLSDLLLMTDGECNAYAQWLLARYKEPSTRLPEITFDVAVSDWALTNAVKRRLRDRVRVRRTPMGLGSAWDIQCLVEGIEQNIDYEARQWRCKLSLSPVDLINYLLISYGKLDLDRLGY